MNARSRWLIICALTWVGFCALLNGCSTAHDAENQSARPWNAPRNWEHGFPTGIYEHR